MSGSPLDFTNEDGGFQRILPEPIGIYEKALHDLCPCDFFFDKPAQRITLLMGPKKPIDYESHNDTES